jgi:hypothetical protein
MERRLPFCHGSPLVQRISAYNSENCSHSFQSEKTFHATSGAALVVTEYSNFSNFAIVTAILPSNRRRHTWVSG